MPYGLRGFGRTVSQDAVCNQEWFGGFFDYRCWSPLEKPTFAPPPAPTGETLTVPPASGEDAQATVDILLNQQMTDQQKVAAANVTSSWWDQASSAAVDTGQAVAQPFGLSIWAWLALGVGGVALVGLATSGGRR